MIRFKKMESKDLEQMIVFENEMRMSEPGVFPDFEVENYKKNFTSIKIEEHTGNEVILCLYHHEIIGRVDLMIEQSFMDFKRIGYVDWVYVLPRYREKGLGRKLFAEAEKYFTSQDCDLYYLFVAKNKQAQMFYSSLKLDQDTISRASRKLK